MDKNIKERLSFNQSLPHRENWREGLALLEEPPVIQIPTLNIPMIQKQSDEPTHLEWVLTNNSQSTSVILVPYLVQAFSTYRVPSFSHLLREVQLDSFDRAWVMFFIENFCHEDVKIVLDQWDIIHSVILTLASANRLRLDSDDAPLQIEQPLKLKARLRYSKEWALMTLDAELVSTTQVVIMPEDLDFITAQLVASDGKLFPLPIGAAWVSQLLESGAWFIAKENLSEALYLLSHKIHDAQFIRDLPEVTCLQKIPLPVVYLRAKQFDKQAEISLYLAFRYGDCEVFSTWHTQDDRDIPIGFEPSDETCILHFRDFASEMDAESQIKNEPGMNFIARKRVWSLQVTALWQLVHRLLRQGSEVWAEKHKLEELTSFGVGASSGIGWFELQAFDTNTRRIIDPLQLIKYLKRKALFIQLGEGRVCVLPERWISHLTQFLEIGQSEENKGWCFSSIYAPEVETILSEELAFQADDAFHSTVDKMRSFNTVTPLEQPPGLRAILRPYQLEGLTWLNLLCELNIGGILADDMGLGKTVQILALLQHRVLNLPNATPKTILVVCPKSVQGHWLHQVKNLTPRLSLKVLHSHDLLTRNHHAQEHQMLLISYGLVRHHIKILSTWHFDFLILDEAQMIKNDSSQTTQAIKQLTALQRFALTGTPIENRFEELVSIFTFLNPHAQLSLGPNVSMVDAVRELVKRALHPFVLRRLKEDVLPDLPPKIVKEIMLSMAPDQGRLYHELLEIYRKEIMRHQEDIQLPTEAETAFFLEGLLRLRQIATHPKQLIGNDFQNCSSNKHMYLLQHIPQLIEKGHRIVVFSQFLGFLKGLSDDIKALNIRHSYVDGETNDREREIALFQSNTAIKVLLISLRVGGVGIDLSTTDVCIIADPWWNEAVEKQAIDRLHRFGQKKPVTVFRLISENSIEEKMEILKQNKSALADALGKTSPDFLTHLKWDDFTEIF